MLLQTKLFISLYLFYEKTHFLLPVDSGPWDCNTEEEKTFSWGNVEKRGRGLKKMPAVNIPVENISF